MYSEEIYSACLTSWKKRAAQTSVSGSLIVSSLLWLSPPYSKQALRSSPSSNRTSPQQKFSIKPRPFYRGPVLIGCDSYEDESTSLIGWHQSQSVRDRFQFSLIFYCSDQSVKLKNTLILNVKTTQNWVGYFFFFLLSSRWSGPLSGCVLGIIAGAVMRKCTYCMCWLGMAPGRLSVMVRDVVLLSVRNAAGRCAWWRKHIGESQTRLWCMVQADWSACISGFIFIMQSKEDSLRWPLHQNLLIRSWTV